MYRSLFKLQFGIKLQRPSNGEHITIIWPEDNIELNCHHYYNQGVLKFSIDNTLFTNGNAIWLNVISKEILQFRTNFGLKKPDIDLHFCIGYLNQGKYDRSISNSNVCLSANLST